MSVLYILFLLSFCSIFNRNDATIFKITKVHCESFNESLAVFNLCRLKPIRRHVSKFYMNLTLTQKFNEINVTCDWRKRSNGYKPFLYNITIDACAFMRRRNNPVIITLFNVYKDFTNLNHTCPYYGDQIVDGFYPSQKNLLNNLPIPNGEYVMLITWILNKTKLLVTDIYFEFYADRN